MLQGVSSWSVPHSDLTIRHAIPGADDETVVNIRNQANKEAPDYQTLLLEDYRVGLASPNADPQAMLIGELNGLPVATVNAYVDKQAVDRKGYAGGPSVLPEFRGQGIGRAMLQQALINLRQRGMTCAQVQVLTTNEPALRLVKSFGFQPVRWDFTMNRNLGQIPVQVGECQDLTITRLSRSPDDIRLIHQLFNETFAEHFDFRFETLEEITYWVEHSNDRNQTTDYFVARTGDVMGIIGTHIDPEEFRPDDARNGWLFLLGVQKPARGKGIAKRLMIHGMQDLKAKGMDQVWLTVDTQNPTHALRLYERLGFQVLWQYMTLRTELTQSASGSSHSPEQGQVQ